MKETLASSSGTGQVFDSEYSDDSIFDIDLSAFFNPVDSAKGAEAGGSGWSACGPGWLGYDGSVSQSDINRIILAQLTSLGERLDSMEKIMSRVFPKPMMCQKLKIQPTQLNVLKHKITQHGSDVSATVASVTMYTVPHPDRLHEEARIQAEVQNRLGQLADNGKTGTDKIKPQMVGGAVYVCVSYKVKWPQ